jgi:hypothetical protein
MSLSIICGLGQDGQLRLRALADDGLAAQVIRLA